MYICVCVCVVVYVCMSVCVCMCVTHRQKLIMLPKLVGEGKV